MLIQQNPMQINSEIPATIYQQAEAYRLGALLAVYKPWLPNMLAVIGMVGGISIASVILRVAGEAIANVIITDWFIIPILAIIYGIFASMDCNLRIYLFSNGLIRAKGNRSDLMRWDQITSIVRRMRRSKFSSGWGKPSFIIQRSDGATFKFNQMLKDIAQLGQHIQQAVIQQQMPAAIAAYNSGRMLPFGPLTVSKQGLSDKRELLSWDKVQSVENKPGVVIIRKVGQSLKWANLPSSQIPNLLIFMELVNYARTVQASYPPACP